MSKLIAVVMLVSLSGIAAAGAHFEPQTPRSWDNGGHSFQAPEIDPSSAMSAVTLLFGGLAVLRGRMSKK
jgi:hypothetical protein